MMEISIPEDELTIASDLIEKFARGESSRQEAIELHDYFFDYPELLELFEVEMLWRDMSNAFLQ